MSKHSITVGNKQYRYSITPEKRGVSRIVCKAANIDQLFENKDVPELLNDLPSWILEKQKLPDKSSTLRFRVAPEEKRFIQKQALKAGFQNTSDYLRTKALSN